ncbi:MAG: hypothetical protein QNJ65_10360 [Xenococcaceae cyanobacterium MO_234.B1]|nr:hypothetical protein [Xenococcaceae cyanobacterium MO_234.B1]
MADKSDIKFTIFFTDPDKTSQIKQFMGFLGERLSGKTIEMEVTANGKSLKVKVSNQTELTAAVQATEQFIMVGTENFS